MQRQTTIKIFKDHSVLNKYMNFSLFMKALDMVLHEYFTKEYDNVVKLDVSSLDAPRKKVLLLEKLKIADCIFVQNNL